MKYFTGVLLLASLVVAAGCADPEPVDPPPPPPPPPMPELPEEVTFTTTDSGLQYAIVVEGTGDGAVAHQELTVHYTGWLEATGEQFDSSRGRGPFRLEVGHGQVIPGWEEGLLGMREGEQRRLVIPPDLAYGEAGSPPAIPPDSTLVFDVEMVALGPDHQY